YLMDFSLRTSGSSVFGTSRKYNTTWSVGLGWNLHKEKFIMDHVGWIDLLKLRASVGNPGNQNFDSAQSLLTYSFQYGSMNYFGQGAMLSQIGNPDLEWQITMDKNIGLDVTLFNKRFSLTADYYYKVTDPLLIKVSVPLSSGTSMYMTNAGEQISQGFTVSVTYYIFQNFEDRFLWMVRGNLRTQKTRIDNIGNKLSTLNASGKGRNTQRYYDGADPDDIWAVKSVGIDPSNGKELFYAKDGSYTYDFSYDEEVICGNTRPDVEGILGTSLNWKGFSVNLNFRYQMGADVFNEALYSKVENISRSDLNKNQDRRALYERWQKEGDVVRFKDIASAETTPMSSRFVQRENVLSLESIYVGYEFYDGWIKKLGLSS
ncbi:MAG: TonB-dependent receptor domain-containing protein, partial [Butyricimonas faecalis]